VSVIELISNAAGGLLVVSGGVGGSVGFEPGSFEQEKARITIDSMQVNVKRVLMFVKW